VFVISWVNPDAKLAAKSFEDYMREGPPRRPRGGETGDRRAQGAHDRLLCVGGTIMAVTLAYMVAKGDDRVLSATFFASQVDFTYGGAT